MVPLSQITPGCSSIQQPGQELHIQRETPLSPEGIATADAFPFELKLIRGVGRECS